MKIVQHHVICFILRHRLGLLIQAWLSVRKSKMCNNEDFIKMFVNPLRDVHFQFVVSKRDVSFCVCRLKREREG